MCLIGGIFHHAKQLLQQEKPMAAEQTFLSIVETESQKAAVESGCYLEVVVQI